MLTALITLIIYLAVAGLLYWLFLYAIDTIPIPDPPARVLKLVAMIVLVLVIIVLLLDIVGVSTGIDLPRLN